MLAALAVVAGLLALADLPDHGPDPPLRSGAPQGGDGTVLPAEAPPTGAGPDLPGVAAFAARLAPVESGGDPLALNASGHAGLFQLSESAARIAGLWRPDPPCPAAADMQRRGWCGRFAIPGYPAVRTLADFLDTPEPVAK
jgi:hypothetical protein